MFIQAQAASFCSFQHVHADGIGAWPSWDIHAHRALTEELGTVPEMPEAEALSIMARSKEPESLSPSTLEP